MPLAPKFAAAVLRPLATHGIDAVLFHLPAAIPHDGEGREQCGRALVHSLISREMHSRTVPA
jgi:hypothetical protein